MPSKLNNPAGIFFFILLLLPALSHSADWPQFYGPDRNGISYETGLNKNWNKKTPEILWRVSMSDDGYAGPCVAGGTVFIIDRRGDDDIIKALDLSTGREKWNFAYADPGDKHYGFARSTPTFQNGKLWTISRMGFIQCLDAFSGKAIWSLELLEKISGELPVWQLALSPLIHGDMLIVCPGGARNPAAIDKNTGKILWTGNVCDVPGYATPVIAEIRGKKQYILFMETCVAGADAVNGKQLWSVPWKTAQPVNAAMPVMINENILVSSSYGHGCALITINDTGAAIIWENKNLLAHFTTPVFYNNAIFGVSDPDNLVCIDPDTGKLLWSQKGFEKGGFLVADGCIFALCGRTGELVLADASAKSYNELGRIKPLGGQSWSPPVLSEKKLIVRNRKELACIDLSIQ